MIVGNRKPAAGQDGLFSLSILLSLMFVAVIAVLGWIALGITAADRWPIKWLEIEGQFERVSAEQVRASLQPLAHTSYFTLKLDAVRDTATGINWIAGAKVRKEWPDTLVVSIVEHKPVAHWNEDKLVSADGNIFSVPEASSLQGLPWLWGADSQIETVVDRWVSFNSDLSPLGLEISSLRMDQRGSWEMTLSNNTRIHMGRDAAEQRLGRLLESWPALLGHRQQAPASIDLRYTNGFAVNWDSDSESADQSRTGTDS